MEWGRSWKATTTICSEFPKSEMSSGCNNYIFHSLAVKETVKWILKVLYIGFNNNLIMMYFAKVFNKREQSITLCYIPCCHYGVLGFWHSPCLLLHHQSRTCIGEDYVLYNLLCPLSIVILLSNHLLISIYLYFIEDGGVQPFLAKVNTVHDSSWLLKFW